MVTAPFMFQVPNLQVAGGVGRQQGILVFGFRLEEGEGEAFAGELRRSAPPAPPGTRKLHCIRTNRPSGRLADPGRFARSEVKANGLGDLAADAILHGATPFYLPFKEEERIMSKRKAKKADRSISRSGRTAAGLLDGPGTGT